MSAHKTIGPRGLELLRALCCYVLQHGNVHRHARAAAEILGQFAGGVPEHERDNALALANLWFALERLERATKDKEALRRVATAINTGLAREGLDA